MRSSFSRAVRNLPAAAIAVLGLSFAVPMVQAQTMEPAPLRSLEDAIESATDQVIMPTSQPGTLTFRNCAEPCKVRSLEVTAKSAFFVGASPVTLVEFNAYVRRAGSQSLMVFFQPNGTGITRLVAAGQLDTAPLGRRK